MAGDVRAPHHLRVGRRTPARLDAVEPEQRGQTTHEAYGRLGRENAYLETLLPRTLDQAAIRNELEAIGTDLKGAKNDGQATGLAMKHLKEKGMAVLGEDVAAAVKQLRTS